MPTRVTGRTRDIVILLDRIIYILAKRWLFAINLAVAIYVGLPILAPVLMAKGYERWGQLIYAVYAGHCHQLPERSYFLYGPRHYYTLEELRMLVGEDVPPRYIGDPRIGYKVAFCERDVALYMTVLIAGIAFVFVRQWLRPLHWRQLVLFALPLAIDGIGQLLGFWESSWISRTITGVLAAAGAVWFVYPYIEAGMQDVRRTVEENLRLAQQRQNGSAACLPLVAGSQPAVPCSGAPPQEDKEGDAEGPQDH